MSNTRIFTVIANGLFIRDTSQDKKKKYPDGGTKNVKMRPAFIGEEVELKVDNRGMPSPSVQAFVDLTLQKVGIVVEETEVVEIPEDEEDL